MKDDFKISTDFHSRFKESLDMIKNEKDKRNKRRQIRKIGTVAASVIMIAAVTIFTASATGIINLDETFKKMFGIENEPKAQELALNLASAPIAESTSGGVTAKVVQAINDNYYSTIIIEFSSQDKILNRNMVFGNIKVDIANTDMAVMSAGFLTESELSKKQTIEEYNNELEEQRKIAKKNGQSVSPTDPGDTEKYLNEAKSRYENNYSNKIYAVVNVKTYDSMIGKNITIDMSKLEGLTGESESKIDYKTIVDGAWKFNWTLSSNIPKKTFKIDKEYSGVHFNEITLSPISIDISYGKDITADLSSDYDDALKAHFVGVRFKNGETRAIVGAGYNGPKGANTAFESDIIDINEVASIFVGDKQVEIPLK